MSNQNATKILAGTVRATGIYLQVLGVFAILVGIPLCYFYFGIIFVAAGIFLFLRGRKVGAQSTAYAEKGLDIAGAITGEIGRRGGA